MPANETLESRETERPQPRIISLSQLLERAVAHEDMPADVDPGLRMGALVGDGLLVVYLLLIAVAAATDPGPEPSPSFFLVGWGFFRTVALFGGAPIVPTVVALGALGGGTVLAVRSQGFRLAPAAEQWWMAVFALVGLASGIPLVLVLLVCAINVAAWILFAVLGVVMACILLGGLASMAAGDS